MTTQLNDLLIDQELKIIDAMELIGKTSARILIIVDKNKRLIGTLTDGAVSYTHLTLPTILRV